MKKFILTVVAASLLMCSHLPSYAETGETQLLVDMLVEKGILSKQEAELFASRAKEMAAKRSREKAQEKVQEEIRAQAVSKPAYTDNMVRTKWDNRLEFETADGNFKGAIGGRLHLDAVYIKGRSELTDMLRPQGDFNRRNDRAIVRRARLYAEGTIFQDFFYMFEYDFAGNLNATGNEIDGFNGAYIGMENIPYIGRFTIGQMKEPFSLEEVMSSNDMTFVERGLPNVFAPGYSWGAKLNNAFFDERATLAVGGFRASTESGTMASSNDWNLTARATVLPLYDGDDKLFHLGTSYSFRLPEAEGPGGNNNNRIRFRERPELETNEFFVNTGRFPVNLENRLGFEGAAVYGPFSAQAEYIQTWLDKPNDLSETGYLYGGYGYVSYFLTGEHRNYGKFSGEFKEVRPKENFSIKDGTWGAWEVAARYSYLCLDDKDVNINGGILSDITFGVNWYLNPNMRVMFNYVHTNRVGEGYGYADGVQTRFQVTF